MKLSEKDQKLHAEFSRYGQNAREWMKKCVLLLPKIEKYRIWEKKGFGSIYEYARVIAGMSKHKVDDSLRILRKIQNKPNLMSVAETKGLNAVRPVAAIADNKSDAFWAAKAELMSVKTLVTFVKDYKSEHPKSRDVTGSQVIKEKVQLSMKLDPEIVEELQKLKGPLDWNEAMKKMLKLCRREQDKIQDELETIKPYPVKSNTRTAPAAIKKFILKRSGGNCEHPNCNKKGKHIHHIEPFALRKTHDPDKMLNLCQEHHKIIHKSLIIDDKLTGKDKYLPASWNQVESLPEFDFKNYINSRIIEYEY